MLTQFTLTFKELFVVSMSYSLAQVPGLSTLSSSAQLMGKAWTELQGYTWAGIQSTSSNLFLLAVSPDSSHGLVIIGGVPVRVKHDQPISTNQIEATPTSLAAQHKHKVLTLQMIKFPISKILCQMRKLSLVNVSLTIFSNILWDHWSDPLSLLSSLWTWCRPDEHIHTCTRTYISTCTSYKYTCTCDY